MSNIKVIVRTRPLNRPREENCIISMTKTSTTIHMPSKRTGRPYSSQPDDKLHQDQAVKTFNFDRCFSSMPDDGPETFASQADVFHDTGTDALENAFQGFNSCIFAYGQTGSGKSHSMMGRESEPGLIPRMARALFEKINSWTDERESFKVEVSFFEIYNEKVHDLLKPSSANKKQYRIREHPVFGPYVDGLTVTHVKSEQEIIDLIYAGNKIRTVAETALNEQSSRSHSILTIGLTRIKYEPELDLSHQTTSKINLVDLAGSERSSVSKTSGQRLKEGSNINKSLTTLGLVIKALVERSNVQASGRNAEKVFVPYRDSVLTWLLKECLGGNSKTVMLATVSPADAHAEETLSTLRYANTAKNIVNIAIINEDPKAKIIRKLLEEISQLKSLLATNTRSEVVDHEINRYRQEIEELKDALHNKEQDMENLRRQSATFRPSTRSLSVVFSDSIDGYSPGRYYDDETQSISSFGGSPTRMLSMTDLSVMPHLVDLNDDPVCSDVLIQYLPVGQTRIGSSPDQDIVLRGEFIDSSHCIIDMHDSNIVFISPTYHNANNNMLSPIDEDLLINLPEESRLNLYPSDIQCSLVYINGKKIESKTRLKHGSRIMLGRTHLFRFNHPQEAYILRQRRITEITSNSDANSEPEDSSLVDFNDTQKRTRRFASIVSGTDYSTVEEEDDDKETLPFIMEKTEELPDEPLVSAISNDINTLEEQLRDSVIFGSKTTPTSTHAAVETPEFDNASSEYDSDSNQAAAIIPFPSYIVDPEKYSKMPTVKVTIPHADLITDATNNTSFHLYHIKITFTLQGTEENWSVYRRYSHIYEFYKNARAPKLISDTFPTYSLAENIGSLVGIPPTRMVEARRKKLETYFNALANWWISEWLASHDMVEPSELREHLPVFAAEKSFDFRSGIWIE